MADAYTLKAIISAVDKLTPTLKVIQAQSQVARKYIGDLGGSINGLASKFGLGAGIFAGIAAGFGIGAIKKAVVSYAELGEEVIKGAYKAGMSTDQYQRMKYVAEQAGVQMDVMGMSMGKLNKNLGAAAMGKNAALVDLMRQLKIPLKDANGQMRNAADLLPQLSKAFVNNQDPVKQAAMGTALYGKAYQEMLPFLNEGPEGIEESLNRFKMLKGVISNDDLNGAKKFGDKLKDLSIVTKGFQMTIASQLVPVISPLVEQFIRWAAVNKKLVGNEVKKVVQSLVDVVKSVDWAAFVRGLGSAVDGIRWFVESVGGMRNVLIGLVLYMNASTIGSVIGLAGAFGRLGLAAGTAAMGGIARLVPMLAGLSFGGIAASLGGVLVVAWPFVLAAAAIAGAAYLVYRNWDVVGPALAGVWERIKTTATVAWNVLRFLFSWSPLGIVVNNWDAVTGWLGAFWQNLKDVASAGLSLLGGLLMQWKPLQFVMDAWDPVVAFFKGVWETISGVIGPILQAAGRIGSAVGGFVNNQFGAGASQQAFGPRFDGPSLAAPAPLALNGPTTNVGGSVTVSFKDAPPGMRVEQTKADNARVPVRTDVGYRYTAAMGY